MYNRANKIIKHPGTGELMSFFKLVFVLLLASQPIIYECFVNKTPKKTNLNHKESVMENKRVLISGAGPAGLACAYLLKKSGFEPTVIEKHPELRTGGYKVDLRGVALDVIHHLGISSQVRTSRTEIVGATLIDGFKEGKEVTIDADLCGGRVEGDVEIMRGDLCKILYDQLDHIEFIFGSSITALHERTDKVKVQINNKEWRDFDFVIGADGLHSKVRELAFGKEDDFIRKLDGYVSIFSVPNFSNLKQWELEYFEPQKFINLYNTKEREEAKAGFAIFTSIEGLEKKSKSEKIQFLKDEFAENSWSETAKILSYLDETKDFYFDCAAQIQMSSWSTKRMVLIGDAGYAPSPLSGQGTSVALTGAYILAKELSKQSHDLKAAFSSYEEKLRPFIKKNQDLVSLNSNFMGDPKKSWKAWFFQQVMKLIPISMIHKVKKYGTSRITKAANAIKLDV